MKPFFYGTIMTFRQLSLVIGFDILENVWNIPADAPKTRRKRHFYFISRIGH